MLRDMNQDDFEDFLKESSDELRMQPSPQVWNGIAAKLNERRRITAFASGGFLLVASLVSYFLIQTKAVVKPLATKAIINTSHTYNSKQLAQKQQAVKERESAIAQAQVYTQPFLQSVERTSGAIVKQLHPSKPDVVAQVTPVTANGTDEAKTVVAEKEIPKTIALSIIDSDPEIEFNARTTKTEVEPVAKKEAESNNSDQLLTIESVTNAFKPLIKKRKATFQVFFTPTVSYRKLSENKAYLRAQPQSNAALNYAVLYNVNDAVTHKPDLGMELGFTAKFPIAKNLKLRAGFQFNVSRYAIKAFTYPTEVTRIALNNSTYGVDYVGSVTNYRNFSNSGNADWLRNMYFQFSTPVGAEVKLAGNDKLSFGVAGTLQPTFILGDRAYMISTDYKNYTEVPWLMRRWNFNTSFETFVSYSTGKLGWQIGPQVRYQMLSSFVTEYPVRENLFDYGLKIGVSLNNNKKSSDNNQ